MTGQIIPRKQQTLSSHRTVFMAVLILLSFAALFFVSQSTPTGLFWAEIPEVLIEVNKTITETSNIPLHFDYPPTSVKISAVAQGQGQVIIRLLSGSTSFVLYNSTVNGQLIIDDACEHTCKMDLTSTEAIIDIELANSNLSITSFSYEYSSDANNPPLWTGKSTIFYLSRNQPLNIDFSSYVVDPESNPLTFVVTTTDNFSVDLSRSKVRIVPSKNFLGEGQIIIYASDLVNTVRIPLTLRVDLLSPAQIKARNSPDGISTDIIDELEKQPEVDVIVVLRDDAESIPVPALNASAQDRQEYINNRIEASSEKTSEVLSTLDLGSFEGRGKRGRVAAALEPDIDFRLKHTYSTIAAFSGRITLEGYEKLAHDPRVLSIVKDLPVNLLSNNSIPYARADLTRNITMNNVNLNGSGFSACIIDSGIDDNHTAFGTRILNQSCYCTASDLSAGGCCPIGNNSVNRSKAFDDYGHGTMVAGIIASQNETYPGVAPAAGIVAIKTFNATGNGLFSDINLAIDHCISNSTIYNITLIMMSFGTNNIGAGSPSFDGSSAGFSDTRVCDNLTSGVGATTSLLNIAAGLGIIPVAAAGNDGFVGGISYPACASNVTSVSAVDQDNSIPDFSSDASINNAWADGVHVCSVRGLNSTNLTARGIQNCDTPPRHLRSNGTSFAAPVIGGGVLVLRQVVQRLSYPNLTVSRVNELLNASDAWIVDSLAGVTRPRISLLSMVVMLARNYTLNETNGSIRVDSLGRIQYVNRTDFTHLLSCVNISSNYININDSGNCLAFNRTVELTIHNDSPSRIYRNGIPCAANCTDVRFNTSSARFNISRAGTFSVDDGFLDINTCRELNESGTTYSLFGNVTTNTTCFDITADNVNLTCNGFSIIFGANGTSNVRGVLAVTQRNIQVHDCNIRDTNATGTDGIGILFSEVNDSLIYNNSIQTNGSSGNYGILVQRSSRNVSIYNNTVRTNGTTTDNYGIYLFTNVTFSDVFNNTIATNGTDGNYGIVVENFSSSINISQNLISAGAIGEANYGIYVLRISSPIQINNNVVYTIGTSTNYGIVIDNSTNNTIWYNNVTSRGTSSDNYGIYLFDRANYALIQNNNVSTNGTARNYGIAAENASNSTIVSNFVKATGNSTDNYGIYLFRISEYTHVRLNTVLTNGTDDNNGIYTLDSGSNNITQNLVYAAGTNLDNRGVYARRSNRTLILSNDINTSGGDSSHGVAIGTSNNVNVTQNLIRSRGTTSNNNGVYVFSDSINTTIWENNITANGTSGNNGVYVIVRSINTTIWNNLITVLGSTNNNYGIWIDDSSYRNTIVVNTLDVRGTDRNRGMYIEANITDVLNNTINTNGTRADNVGYMCDDAQNHTLRNNIIEINGTSNGSVVFLSGCALVYAENNTFTSYAERNLTPLNQSHGLHFNQSRNNTFIESPITILSGGDAIRLFNMSDNNTFANLTLVTANVTPDDDGVDIRLSRGNLFRLVHFNNNTGWIRTDSGSPANNFTFANFTMANVDPNQLYSGQFRMNGTFVVNSSQTINRSNLWIVRVGQTLAVYIFRINTTQLPYLNISTQIRTYGDDFPASRINLIYDPNDDGSWRNCTYPRCEFIENSAILEHVTFNVSGWTSYGISVNSTANQSGSSGSSTTSTTTTTTTRPSLLDGYRKDRPPRYPPKQTNPLPNTDGYPLASDGYLPSETDSSDGYPPQSSCGNLLCEPGEDHILCPEDCTPAVLSIEQPSGVSSWTILTAILFGTILFLLILLALLRHVKEQPLRPPQTPPLKKIPLTKSEGYIAELAPTEPMAKQQVGAPKITDRPPSANSGRLIVPLKKQNQEKKK